jgi:hypothetical protein
METSTYTFADSGLARCLLHPAMAALWLALAAVGLTAALRRYRDLPPVVGLTAAGLAGLAITVWGLSNPGHPRYSIPLLELGCLPVVVGLATLLRRFALPALGVAAVTSMIVVAPALATYRTRVAPPLIAVHEAVVEAAHRGAVVVADPTLVSFVERQRAIEGMAVSVLYADQIASGQTPPPPPFATVAVWDDGHDTLVERTDTRHLVTCSQSVLRRLSQGRFLDLTVAGGASLKNGRH